MNLARKLATLLALFPITLSAQQVVRLSLHDTIQPVSAEYLSRGLAHAADVHASAVLISLGTPGGLLTSTREMVDTIEHSPVPVIIYISPSGARGGSAGFFLLEAADVAAMAPSTNAGAAHPVLEGQTMDPVLKLKIENDAAAFMRSYVTIRGRNVAAAEDAIRNSKSYTEAEALQLKLIDLTAADDAALLAKLDGTTIRRFDGTTQTLHLTNATIERFAPSTRERLLGRLVDPNIAVLLLFVGALLIYLEFNIPGTIIPGAVGALCVLLALFALHLLPISHAALLLLIAAFALILLEIKFPSHGIVGLAGVIALIFSLATLVRGPIPELRVHWATALAAGAAFGAITLALAYIGMKARRNKVRTGPEAMVGLPAIAQTPLNPTGQVEVRGELWHARLINAVAAPAGAALTVRAVDALTLLVTPDA